MLASSAAARMPGGAFCTKLFSSFVRRMLFFPDMMAAVFHKTARHSSAYTHRLPPCTSRYGSGLIRFADTKKTQRRRAKLLQSRNSKPRLITTINIIITNSRILEFLLIGVCCRSAEVFLSHRLQVSQEVIIRSVPVPVPGTCTMGVRTLVIE